MQLPDANDESVTETPTTGGPPASLQALGSDDAAALRTLGRNQEPLDYAYPLADDAEVDTPFPLDEAQVESLREGARQPAGSKAATAVRGLGQAVIGGRSREPGWGLTAFLGGPVVEGLAQYLEWAEGARDKPDLARMVFESASPLAVRSLRDPHKQTLPPADPVPTERETAERLRPLTTHIGEAKRRVLDLPPDELTWEDLLGTPEDPGQWKRYFQRREDEEMARRGEPEVPDYYGPRSDPSAPPPGDPRGMRKPPRGMPSQPPKGWDKVGPGPLPKSAENPLGKGYRLPPPMPEEQREEAGPLDALLHHFRKGGAGRAAGRAGGYAVARGYHGEGPAYQSGVNPQFLRRVDAELEARMKGERAFSIFAPFTTDQLQRMRDLKIHESGK
jgi:hypothetical protein